MCFSNIIKRKDIWLVEYFLAFFLILLYNFSMRVVAGKYRGKKLKEFNLETTKPTLDKVKESIFNLIQFDVADAVVLDLFSGTGALGIEAISRGAKKTYLIDNNKDAIKLINENLKGVEGNYEILNLDFKQFLNSTNEKFDIVLLDPPYNTDFGKIGIELIMGNNLLKNNGIIIFETSEKKEVMLEDIGFDVKKKKYGSVAVYKLTKEKNEI